MAFFLEGSLPAPCGDHRALARIDLSGEAIRRPLVSLLCPLRIKRVRTTRRAQDPGL